MTLLLVAVVFLLVGALTGALWARARFSGTTDVAELATLREQLRHAQIQGEFLESERIQLGEQAGQLRVQVAVLQTQLEHERQNDEVLTAKFDALAKASLKENSEQLIKTAESSFKLANEQAKGDLAKQQLQIQHLVQPVEEHIGKLEAYMQQSEKARSEQWGGLFEQMQAITGTNQEVRDAAKSLRTVLSTSTSARGRWGEIQLRRVVELAGMVEHVDFTEQTSITTDDGRSRADLVVHYPGDMQMAIDAKVPFSAYQQAMETEDSKEQTRLLKEHSKQFRAHVDTLAKRAYWEQYTPGFGYTVLFVPNDALFDAARMHDPTLHERAIQQRILIATPQSLILMLSTFATGWAQQSQAENAAEIAALGKELLKRMVKADEHVTKIGRALGTAVKSYNDFVGSYDTRVKSQAQKLSKLSGAGVQFQQLGQVEAVPREIRQRHFDDTDHDELLEITEHSEAG